MDTINHILLRYPEVVYSATAFVVCAALIYKIATRKMPSQATVNCWFCNMDTVVPFGNRNRWDCPNCEQYNGFQENGDYNKPIPAQFKEDLNHGVSAVPPSPVSPRTLQWVNSQMLLCKKCNKNQSAKIKQLASFIPREDENYDEEIDTYKYHLEQTYKLCRPCEAAVGSYIKFQNRQLHSHQLGRSRDPIQGFVKGSSSVSSPLGVILLRALAFMICAFLVATSVCELSDKPSSLSVPQTLSEGSIHSKPNPKNQSAPNNETNERVWQSLLELLPETSVEYAKMMWQYGKNRQLAVVCFGLMSCLIAIFLGGSVRLRGIDAVASVIWFLIFGLHLSEHSLTTSSSWMDTAKVTATSLCFLVSFAAVATRKPLSLRRGRYRRCISGSSAVHPFSSQPPLWSPDMAEFIPTPPPNLSKLIKRMKSPREHKASPSSLPGRLSRALSLGTIPSFSRTDSGYLFSGSRPASQYKDYPPSDFFSLKSWSRPSSPGPSPTPSVAGSIASSSSSARQRRPLISPARLNISGQRLGLFSTKTEPTLKSSPPSSPHYYVDQASVYSGRFSPHISPLQSQNDFSSVLRDGSVMDEKQSNSSGSSACLVGTTTECTPPPEGFVKRLISPGLLLASLSANLFFACLCIYHNWKW